MKFTAFAAIVASAALVSASPLRVVVVTSNNAQRTEPFPGGVMRFGHAVPQPMPMPMHMAPASRPGQNQQRRPCMGGRFRQKAVDLSNSFRKMFGFPLIESGEFPHNKEIHGGMVKILPFMPGSGAPTFANIDGKMRGGDGWRGRMKGGERIEIIETIHFPQAPPNVEGRIDYSIPRPVSVHHGYRNEDFLIRIQSAIMSLGPWEGRAVAFVLGCGIGVLLRMFFVLAVVLYRSVRGSREEHEYQEVEVIVFEVDENENRRSAPPAYIYPVDEKVAVKTPVQADA